MIKNSPQLRLRVFAGPNGSGKSTVIEFVRKYKSGNLPIDFGHYINADDIASQLSKQPFDFSAFNIQTTPKEFKSIALDSGLINFDYTETVFLKSFSLQKNKLKLSARGSGERLAQIIADFLRKKLLAQNERFSFETVFSHSSKLDIMREAAAKGYKVYLYFVSTESPEINKFRVLARKKKGGHDVPPEKIESRYYRSLDLLFDASQIAYQAFFFDNSFDGQDLKMFAHFKVEKGIKNWDRMIKKDVPQWFIKYYSNKVISRKK